MPAALATHTEIAFAAATTGPANVVAFTVTRDAGTLFEYLATDLGALPGLQQVETAPVMRTLKRADATCTARAPPAPGMDRPVKGTAGTKSENHTS